MSTTEANEIKDYAEISGTKVVNTFVWDGVTDFTSEYQTVPIPDGLGIGIGWDYINGKFVDNRPVEELPTQTEGE